MDPAIVAMGPKTVAMGPKIVGPPMVHQLTLLPPLMMQPMLHPHVTKLRIQVALLNNISKKGDRKFRSLFIPFAIDPHDPARCIWKNRMVH